MSSPKRNRAFLIMAGLVLLSFATYSLVWSWEFAVLLIGALMFHEYGHIWAMKRCGVPTSGIYLIPFVGGAAVASDKMPSRNADVFISLMGPVFGFALAGATALVYAWTGWTVLAAATVWMIIVNLFNLVPVYPLDGGRVLKCVAHSLPFMVGLGFMGMSALAALWMFALTGTFLMMLVALFAFMECSNYMGRPRRQRFREYLTDTRERIEREGDLPIVERSILACRLGLVDDSLSYQTLPSMEELLPLLERYEEGLREPPSLTAKGIVISLGCWFLLIGAYAALLIYAGKVSGVFESFSRLTGHS